MSRTKTGIALFVIGCAVFLLAALSLATGFPFGAADAREAPATDPSAIALARGLDLVNSTLAGGILFGALGAYLWSRGRRAEAVIVVAAFVATLGAVGVLKLLVHHPRPANALIVEPTDPYGFPSGHAARAGLIVAFAFLAPRMRWAAVAVALGYLVLQLWGRLALAVHVPSDVVAGAGIGLAVGGAALVLMERFAAPAR